MLNRRQAIALGVTGGSLLLPAIGFAANADAAQIPDRTDNANPGHDHNAMATTTLTVDPPSLAPFSVPMPVPATLAPVFSEFDTDFYVMSARAGTAAVFPGLNTPMLTYRGPLNGQPSNAFIGPTIRAKSGRQVIVAQYNQLDMDTNVHLHGAHTPAASDGHPIDLIPPGGVRLYRYPNRQRGTTLWYHDHAHHMEAEHVYRGLHGFYLLEDPDEAQLRLPSGEFDVPIMLRDAAFDQTGALVFSPMEPEGRTTMLANGKPQPYFQVAARKYRFRILNAANLRPFVLNLGGMTMTQIGSDGGLLPAPVPRTDLLLSPGERAEIVVDFTGRAIGSNVVLASGDVPLIRFDVVRQAADTSQVPDVLRPLPAVPAPTATRRVDLSFAPGVGFQINGASFDPARVDAQIRRGTTEVWEVTNRDPDSGHNLHLHLVQFLVLGRNGGGPWPGESGWKDTVPIPPGQTVRIQATFADFLGRYVYHCHLMEHSASGMMAQFEIVP